MAGTQSTVGLYPAVGVPGDLDFTGPSPRVQPRICYHASKISYFGYAFTETTDPDYQLSGTVQAGGSGLFAGILVQPKASASNGTSVSPLAPTLALPNYATGQLMKFGSCYVSFPAAAAIGDLVEYTVASGAIAKTYAETASFTAAQSTTTLTVSAITAGNIGLGSVVKNAAGEILGTVIALGTGTGGTGTYTLNTSATVSSAAMTANSAAAEPATSLLIPNAVVDRFSLAAAGVGIITLTN